MTNIKTITDVKTLRESVDLECKLAVGRDGQGAVPEDFWPTYSAFANTNGGVVIKLTADLKVPFVLKGDLRQDDTLAHQALREALVNTLVHADFTGRISVRVIKEPSGFVFRNPGALRVPAEQALQGGLSDCRNRTIQQMFLMIGLGERAGSGLPKIIYGWQRQGQILRLSDTYEPAEFSTLEMRWAIPSQADDTVNGTVNGTVNENDVLLAELDEIDKTLLSLLRKNGKSTLPELAKTTGKSVRTVKRRIEFLKGKYIRRVGSDKTGH